MIKQESIKELARKNNGIVTTKMLDENNIHRQYLKSLVDDGYFIKVSRGIYVTPDRDISNIFS